MNRPRIFVLGAALAIGACHGDSHGSGPATPQVRARKAAATGPSVAEQTAGMVEAPGLTASNLGVRLKFALGARPVAGQPLGVDLALLPSMFAESATVDVAPSADLAVGDADREFTLRGLEPNKVFRHAVTVTPATPGVTEIDLTVSVRHDALVDTRKFSIPLIVDAGSAPAEAAPGAAPSSAAAAH